ncbi:MAG: alpha/beta hydrolase [Hyphomicrobiales bacterium]
MNVQPSKIRQEIEALLGHRVAESRFIHSSRTSTQDQDGWVLERWLFETSAGEEIPGTFLRPAEGDAQVPAILYCHAHGNRYAFGMDELMEGRGSLQGAYGPALQELGIASLCLEMPAFGARQDPDEPTRTKAHLWHGRTLFGQMLAEQSAGISFLADQPVIDPANIGALGFSMGSTHAWWLAALDERIKAAVALCSFADLETLIATGDHNGHGIYMMVPGLVERFSSAQVAGLAAPRALMIGVGLQDWSTPDNCFQPARTALEAAYAQASGKLHVHIEPDHGHEETPAMRTAALNFLESQLQ